MKLPRTGSTWISIFIFLFLWADLVRQLSFHWNSNPQYAFGWTVPMLSLFLLWECWFARPAPGPALRGRNAIFIIAICAVLLLPTRLLLETTPDWRFADWALALEVIGLSLASVYLAGGRPWLHHFAFPIAFNLVAVPWPVKFEQAFVQTLSQWVAALTVHGLNLCQIPAIKHGNLIEISAGVVGVEEACSGVRSFQATLMAALFLGQLWTFRWRTRLVLVGAGVALAFVCNVVRAWFLAFVAEKNGLAAIGKWHDPAGFTILAVCFLGLLGIAKLLSPKSNQSLAPAEVPPARRLSVGLVAVLGAWVLIVAAGTELWYRTPAGAPAAWWRVEWPDSKAGYAEIPMTDAVRTMKFDDGHQGRWKGEDGTELTMFFFRWLPGQATSRISARWHNPEICLTAAGFKLAGEFDLTRIKTAEIELVFRTYRFEQQGKPVYVFFCIWEDRRDPDGEAKVPEQWTPASRWRAVLQRRRKVGQQTLEVAITGVATEQEARAAFQRNIVPLVRPDDLLHSENRSARTADAGDAETR